MRRGIRVAVVACVAGLWGVSTAAALPRVLADRPDDIAGPHVHLIYAIPRDGVDRGRDMSGAIAGSFSSAQRWLVEQTGGRRMRLDTYHGEADVTFVRLPEENREISRHGIYARDEIEALIRALGFKRPGKIYEVFYDGSSAVCGSAPWPPSLPGRVPVVFLSGAPPGGGQCDAGGLARSGEAAGYLEMDELHEIIHTLAIAPDCSPHSTHNGHVDDSPTDLMYQGPLPWDTAHMVLDFHHDDYFEASVNGCLDLKDSAFLEGGTQLPPAWNRPPPRAPLCVVPRLTGLSVLAARRALTDAYCRLGAVRGPRGRRRRTVVGQSSRPETVHPGGFRVDVGVRVA